MKKTLGLDLGTNSLGWAILDDITGDILDKGVVVFPEGIDAAKDTLDTPAAVRRAKRMGRRLKFRRKLRKWVLLKLLIENGMCPMTEAERVAWKSNGKYPIDNKAFVSWLKSTDVANPYGDRANAAEKKVDPLVLGRALYHICQRRGFKSSRKDAGGDEAREKDLGEVKGNIFALSKEIEAAGCKTLGQYFAKCLDSQKNSLSKTRIRNRHTGRIEHYLVEFDAIMKAQGLLDSELASKLKKAIFDQRPLRSQNHLVGKCPLEPKLPRVQIGHPAFEEFRMLAFVNNLSFENADTQERVPLSKEDREKVIGAFMKASPTMKFKDVSKLFKKRFAAENLRFHYYRDDEAVACCSTRQRLRNGFGDVPFDEQKVFDALTFFDDDEKLAAWFGRHYPALNQKQVGDLCKIHPKEGNAHYSLKAINRILPFLRKGFVLSTARFLAKMPEILPEFSTNEDEIVRNLREIEYRYRQALEERKTCRSHFPAEPMRLMDMWREYFLNKWGIQDDAWNLLYLRDARTYAVDPRHPDRLPAVQLGMIRNPLVQRSMTTLRRLVNYLRDHNKIDGDTTIRIELARSVNDYASRHALQMWQKDREQKRADARDKLGSAANEDAVERYLLAEEQGFKCLYTGRPIRMSEILTGDNFDIEHTVPRSLSGDDSQANKTLCDANFNRNVKKGRLPVDCPGYEQEIWVNLRPWRDKIAELEKTYNAQRGKARFLVDPGAKAQAKIKKLYTWFELNYWRDKLHRFEMRADKLIDPAEGLSGFKRRQLVDSGIMSSHAVELLRVVYPNVYSVNGAATAFARKAWGIQEDAVKDRSNHTHHAKDAMVIAALTPGRFNAICAALKDDGDAKYRRPCDVCGSPYERFAEKVRVACGEILVKHVMRQTTLRQSSKRNALAKAHVSKADPTKIVKYVLSKGDTVRGPLHKDTFYGCIQDPASGILQKVVRKPLVGPVKDAEDMVDNIVDPTIRSVVEAAIVQLKAEGVKNIEPGMIKMVSGVPVNRVRVFAKNARNASVLRAHTMVSDKDYKTPYYVVSAEGSNFRMGIFNVDGKLAVRPDNSLDWAQNHKKPDYLPMDRQDGFIGYICPGIMALTAQTGSREELEKLSPAELTKRLYRVVKFKKDGRITFRRHIEARASVVLEADLAQIGKNKDGESEIDFMHPHELLRVSPGKYLRQMLFEGIHFKMMLDGSIKFV